MKKPSSILLTGSLSLRRCVTGGQEEHYSGSCHRSQTASLGPCARAEARFKQKLRQLPLYAGGDARSFRARGSQTQAEASVPQKPGL
jgi:hypothetical protein